MTMKMHFIFALLMKRMSLFVVLLVEMFAEWLISQQLRSNCFGEKNSAGQFLLQHKRRTKKDGNL